MAFCPYASAKVQIDVEAVASERAREEQLLALSFCNERVCVRRAVNFSGAQLTLNARTRPPRLRWTRKSSRPREHVKNSLGK